MSTDPDFHPAASAWLDGQSDDGTQRLLADLLRDSPGAAVTFASLARADALLQSAGLTPAERLRRAEALLCPARGRRILRYLNARTLTAAAAALVLAGALWHIRPQKAEVEPDTVSVAPPRIERSVSPRERPVPEPERETAPPDRTFLARMERFIIPQFSVSALPLTEALTRLEDSVRRIDPEAVPSFQIAGGTGEALVRLHVSYLSVNTLISLIAIQTGTRLTPSGKGYLLAADSSAPMPGPESTVAYAAPAGFAADSLPDVLGEPASGIPREGGAGAPLRIQATARMHRLLACYLPTQVGTPPGTWHYTVKLIVGPASLLLDTDPAVPSRQDAAVLSEDQFQLQMRALSQLRGVDLSTQPLQAIRPGLSREVGTVQESPDPQRPDDWSGVKLTLTSEPEGDQSGNVRLHFVSQSEAADPQTGEPVLNVQQADLALTFWDAQTIQTAPLDAGDGRQVIAFITANREAPVEDLPYGTPVVGKRGMVYSPYAPDKGGVDVTGIPPGTKVKCPFTGNVFRVP